MAIFPVSPQKQLQLQELMRRLGVREEELEERFIRSGGPGGQNVNKVSTCVVLRHRPSGLEVRCQQERSQALNRYLARRILLRRLEAQRLGRVSFEAQRLNCDNRLIVVHFYRARASGVLEIGSGQDVIKTPIEVNALDDSNGNFGGAQDRPLGYIYFTDAGV